MRLSDQMDNLPKHDPMADPSDSWFEGGAPVPEDFVDPDFEGLGSGATVTQGLILAMVVGLAALMALQYTRELGYFFTERAPIDLNAGADEQRFVGPSYYGDDGLLELPSNRFVEVRGVPQRRSAAGTREFFALVGSQIYVERRVEDDRPRILRGTPRTIPRGMESARVEFEGRGRLIAFEKLPGRYDSFVDFYSRSYRIPFCGKDVSPELESYRNRVRRQAEVALRADLDRQPTEQENRERAGPAAGCQRGYLLIEGEDPRAFWFFPAVYFAFACIVLGAFYLVTRYLRDQKR